MIMCGSTEIDGHTFCLGLEFSNTALEVSISQITFLIRGAIFRSRHISRRQGRLSLHICSLGELIDMYHAYAAKIRHDKIFALLGMSSDDLGVASLEPDYKVPWSKLMRSLVKFLVSNDASVDTWDDKEIAIIKSKGRVLGQVSSILHKLDNRRHVQIIFKYVLGNLEHKVNREISWTLPSLAKPIKKGDIICLLQGALKPTIVRACKDYFAIIMMVANPQEHIRTEWSDPLQLGKFSLQNFLLVWDWENSSEKLQSSNKYDVSVRKIDQLSENTKISMEGRMDNAIRIWNFAQILGHVGAIKEAEEKKREATEIFKIVAIREEHLHSLECQCGLIPLIWATEIGENAVINLLLTKDNVDLDLKDYYGQTPLSRAAENGHKAVVKLLLKRGAELETKDNVGQTSLSRAAGNGHEAVVKLLLERGAELETKDNDGQTLLSQAAQNGHKAVVKLLLERGAELETKDKFGQTPLSQAAEYRHEAVVKLLLEKGAELETKDNNGKTPLSWAAWNRDEAVVKLLLERGAELETKDNNGKTPLLQAAEYGHKAVVKLLLEKGVEKLQ